LLVHRDIKPGNLMLNRAGNVKVADFGLAKFSRESEKGRDHNLTGTNAMMGTPAFMAPEQARDAKSADIRADIYSLGCTFYYLLTGHPPFECESIAALLFKHWEAPRPDVSLLRNDVPWELSQYIQQMMAKDAGDRPATPKEIVDWLAKFAKGELPKKETVAKPIVETAVAVKEKADEELKFELFTPEPTAEKTDIRRRGMQPKKKWPMIAGAIACLLVGFAILVAAGVLKVQTKDGTIVLENLPADSVVLIDGDTVKVTSDGKTFEIRVPADKKHRLEVKKDGFKMFGSEIEVEIDGRKSVAVHLEPIKVPVAVKLPKDLPKTETVVTNTALAASDGFVPLFNGRDLAGWKSLGGSKATWKMKDGVLSGSGGTGYLFNDGKGYTNFHLRVEAMINDGGNSGVYFRAPFGPTTPQGHPAFGYEAQININHKDPNKTGSLYLTHKVVAGLAQTRTELNEWFALEVIADGPRVVVKVNGAVTANFIDLAIGGRSGRIALQVLEADTVVKFRKIEIKELPPDELRLQYPHGAGVFEQVKGNVWLERNGEWLGYFREHARNNDEDGGGTVRLNRRIENDKTGVMHITRGNGAWWNVQGTTRWTRVFSGGWSVLARTPPPEKSTAARFGEWAPLFNGKDTGGWEAAGNMKATWTYEGGAIVGRSDAAPAGLLLSNRGDYENFRLRLEARLGEGGFSSLLLRCGPAKDSTTGNKCYAIRIGDSTGAAPITGTLVLSAHFDEAVPLALADAVKVPIRPDEWFALEVIVEGNRLRVLVKEKTVVDFTDANATFTAGRFGLVCRGNSTARFRNMEVKELPPNK